MIAKQYDDAVKNKTAALLRKELWVVLASVASSKEALAEYLEGHFSFVLDLERQGKLFAAGPFLDDNGENSGNGLLIIRAGSRDEVLKIMEADPLFTSGVRNYEIVCWQLNVGSNTMRITYSDQTGTLL